MRRSGCRKLWRVISGPVLPIVGGICPICHLRNDSRPLTVSMLSHTSRTLALREVGLVAETRAHQRKRSRWQHQSVQKSSESSLFAGAACSDFAGAACFAFARAAFLILDDPASCFFSGAASVFALGPGFRDLKQFSRCAICGIARQCATSSIVARRQLWGLGPQA
jgi:hypothetical protein